MVENYVKTQKGRTPPWRLWAAYRIRKLERAREERPLPWREWADHSVRRLKGGRDYHVSSDVLEEAARQVAKRLGQVAVVFPEDIMRWRYWEPYVWLQFVDGQVEAGDPCACGSRDLVRTHPRFVHCAACGAHLALKNPKDAIDLTDQPYLTELPEGEGAPAERKEELSEDEWRKARELANFVVGSEQRAAQARRKEREHRKERRRWQAVLQKADERLRLDRFKEVGFVAREERRSGVCLHGYGVDGEGQRVLLRVDVPLDAEPAPEKLADIAAGPHELASWPVEPFSEIIDWEQLLRSGRPLSSTLSDISPWEPMRPAERGVRAKRAGGSIRAYRFDLNAYSDVHFRAGQRLSDRERRFGVATDPHGRRALIFVDFVLDGEGRPVPDPGDPARPLCHIHHWATVPLGGAIDRRAMEG
jgi:hypothetical protein